MIELTNTISQLPRNAPTR